MTTTKRRYIGKRTIKYDALERVTGKAVFGADLTLPGTLYAKVLRSPYPHARIRAVRYDKALAVEGVKGVITFQDLPPLKEAGSSVGGELIITIGQIQRLVLANEKALWEGHPVAAVAATSLFIAEEAVKLIEVDYEELPVVQDVLEAMKPGAPLLHDDQHTFALDSRTRAKEPSNIAQRLVLEQGDIEAGFAEADVVLENTFHTEMVHQGYIEPQACTALWDSSGHLTVWTTTQGHFGIRQQLSQVLGVPLSEIKVVPLEIGGGFGGKIIMIVEPLAALLSRKTGRPVKLVLTREEVLKATGPASPAVYTIKTGAKNDGRLTAISARMVFDAGCVSGSPMGGAAITGFGAFKCPNIRVEGYDVVTNKPRVQAYRAPGGPQTAFAVCSQMDSMAQALGMDPVQFYTINAVDTGDKLLSGVPLTRIGLKELLKSVAGHPAWTTPLEEKNRGRGFAVGYWGGATGHSSAYIQLNPDGTVNLLLGPVDLTGTRTTMQQICAEELGVPLEHIHVSVGDTDSAGYSMVSAGSRVTYSLGTAVYRACQDTLAQLKERAAEQLKVPLEEIEYNREETIFRAKSDASKVVSFLELAQSTIRRPGPVLGKGFVITLKSAPSFSAGVVDVEVDPGTGKVKVLRYTAFQDVGCAVNPTQVEGQIQGGVVQGIGWGLNEEYVYERGLLRNASLLDYRTPTALDVPRIDVVLTEVPAEDGPYGVRGVGEAPLIHPPAALANAIARAIGVRVKELPLKPETVFWAIHRAQGDGHRQYNGEASGAGETVRLAEGARSTP
jgi:CO/xanthine dehydrogenase Mo-binding subunit